MRATLQRVQKVLYDARSQVILVGVICFLCPGMFNALNSIEDESPGVRKIKSLCTALLYLSFSVFSLIAGGLNNLLGPRVLLVFGAATYALFVASKYAVHVADIANPLGQWNGSLPMSGPRSGNGSWNVKNATVSHESLDGTVSGNHNGATQGWNGTQSNWTQWEAGYQSSFMAQTYFAYTSSVLLGMGAGCLWAAQGLIVIVYPTDDQRGTYFAIFWIIFNLGAVVSSLIAFGESSMGSQKSSLPTVIYITFIALASFASLLALCIASPGRVVRSDKSKVYPKPTTVFNEMKEIAKLFLNPAMLILVIPFASSNWFYTYQFGVYQQYFDARTQTFDNMWFWMAQMAGSWIMGNLFLDELSYGGRVRRAWFGFAIVAVSTVAVWGSAIVYQYYIDDFADHSLAFYDTSSENWVYWPFGLTIYIFFGLFDAFYQSYTYWLIGSLSHDAAINSRYAGFYKSIQSLFAAISWILGDTELSTQFPNVFRPIDISDMAWIGISVGPLVASCVCFAFFVHFYVTDFAEEDEWVEMDEEKV